MMIAVTMPIATVGILASAAAPAERPSSHAELAENVVREPVIGVGYHPGNFIGPVAFDVIARPFSQTAIDAQMGYESDSGVKHWQLAPQLQFELLRRWITPYLGLGFRYERASFKGVSASSIGEFIVAGLQARWRSGIGVLGGIGVLHMTGIDLRAPHGGYGSEDGTFGTYEVGVRYFF